MESHKQNCSQNYVEFDGLINIKLSPWTIIIFCPESETKFEKV